MIASKEKDCAPHTEKPLLGFGWMGWVLLAIAGTLVVVWVTGYDLQYQLFAMIQSLFGNDGLYWFSYRVIIWHSLTTASNPPWTLYGLWGLCAVLIAFRVWPHQIRWWHYAMFIGWAFVAPPLSETVGRHFFDLEIHLNLRHWYVGTIALGWTFTISLCVLLALVTRSKRVIAGVLVLRICDSAVTFFMLKHGLFSSPEWLVFLQRSIGWLWNPLLLAILLSWAIPARIRHNRWWLCSKCRYDMRKLDTTTCPECGTANERMPAPETGAISTDS